MHAPHACATHLVRPVDGERAAELARQCMHAPHACATHLVRPVDGERATRLARQRKRLQAREALQRPRPPLAVVLAPAHRREVQRGEAREWLEGPQGALAGPWHARRVPAHGLEVT